MTAIRTVRSAEAPSGVLATARRLLDAAFDDFSDDDWDHALGGWHVLAAVGDVVVAHAAVVPRRLEFDGISWEAGYVEAVATTPQHQARGIGSLVMLEVVRLLRREYAVGVLSTGRHRFYERLGWERWRGRSYVRHDDHTVRTPEDDDGLMLLRFGASRHVPLTGRIVCEARPGDDW